MKVIQPDNLFIFDRWGSFVGVASSPPVLRDKLRDTRLIAEQILKNLMSLRGKNVKKQCKANSGHSLK